MKATSVVAAVLSLVPLAAQAQPANTLSAANLAALGTASGRVTFTVSDRTFGRVVFGAADAPVRPVYAKAEPTVPSRLSGISWILDAPVASALEMTGNTASLSVTAWARFWLPQQAAKNGRNGRVNWLGLLTEQVQIDGVMHMFRLREPKTHRELYHSRYLEGYVGALKGYFDGEARWQDGDPFFGNNINHPLMGSVYAHNYLSHDRKCASTGYGDGGYWGCIGRAAVYAALGSTNWEWNPVMSESAIGHVGKFYACPYGKCTGEGGWTDFVMTPAGGIGMSIAGDIARAKLWPSLDRHLSGNLAARILKTVLKVATDPSSFAHAAFTANFKDVMASRVSDGRR